MIDLDTLSALKKELLSLQIRMYVMFTYKGHKDKKVVRNALFEKKFLSYLIKKIFLFRAVAPQLQKVQMA